MNVDIALGDVMERVNDLLDSDFSSTGKHYAEISPELFLWASTFNDAFKEPFEKSGGSINGLKILLKEALAQEEKTDDDVRMSAKLSASMNMAALVASTRGFAGISYVDVVYLLVSQYQDVRYYLDSAGANISQFIDLMYGKAGMRIPLIERTTIGRGAMPGQNEMGMEQKSFVEQYTTDMIALAKKTEEPLVGREAELEKTIRILCRKSKANAVHVGDPGVGKTTIILGLAKKIVADDVPAKLKGYEVYALDTGAIMAGARFRGDTEERVKGLLDELEKKEKVILYIDEIHNLIGTGSTGTGGMDLGGLLKTALTSSHIRFIGSTTYDEYRQYFEKDKALSRRFKMVEILEPTIAEAKEIIRGILPHYEKYHDVTYSADAVDASVELTAKYMHEKFLPDKAIDMIDEAGAMFSKDGRHGEVTKAIIERLVAESCKIPPETIETDDKLKLMTLASEMKKHVFGQDAAIDSCVQALKLARSGLQDENKPVANFLFVGQTGVGKTEIAKQLAKHMGVDLVRFDMSEYADETAVNKLVGASAGYVGYEDGGLLVEQIRKHPNSVLLLDEIEKAHPKVFNVLLQVMDNAELTDNKGRKADFRNVILIMTSNAGASGVVSRGLGFGVAQEIVDMGNMKRAVEKTFTPEFRNRLTEVITLNSMDDRMAANIVDLRMRDLTSLLESKGIRITYSSRVLDYLKDKGITKEFGARELLRVINSDIKMLFVDGMLVGEISDGSTVKISMKDSKPVIKVC